VIVHVDQVYREVSGVALRYDFMRPNSPERLPLVVAIHGGGWISGDKSDYRDMGIMLADQGFAVAIPQYRLAPLHPFPAATDDILAFARFCRTQDEFWNVNSAKMGAIGNSAGGHLVAYLGTELDPEARPRAVVSLCPISDLTRPREQHFPIAWSFLEQFIPKNYDDAPADFEAASPLSRVHSEAATFLIFHGEADDVVPVSQSDALTLALEKAGVSVSYYRMPGEDHSFSGGAWPFIQTKAIEFLREQLS
jgi:acetyl esterase/lipase